MTKAGEGKGNASRPTEAMYHHELSRRVHSFELAMQRYVAATNEEEKKRAKATMDEQLHLIRSVAQEIPRLGIHKQEARLESSYRKFLDSAREEHLSALRHDLKTLLDFNS